MSKVIDAKNWSLTPAPDGRRYSKYPDGNLPSTPASWNLPATISVPAGTSVGVRQYTADADGWTIAVTSLATGLSYNSGTESIDAADTTAASGTATFTLSKSGETDVVDTTTVALASTAERQDILMTIDFSSYTSDTTNPAEKSWAEANTAVDGFQMRNIANGDYDISAYPGVSAMEHYAIKGGDHVLEGSRALITNLYSWHVGDRKPNPGDPDSSYLYVPYSDFHPDGTGVYNGPGWTGASARLSRMDSFVNSYAWQTLFPNDSRYTTTKGFTNEYWLGFAVWFPSDFIFDTGALANHVLTAVGLNTNDSIFNFGFPSIGLTSDPRFRLAVRNWNGNLGVTQNFDWVLSPATQAYLRGKHSMFVFHWKADPFKSSGATGFIKVWHNVPGDTPAVIWDQSNKSFGYDQTNASTEYLWMKAFMTYKSEWHKRLDNTTANDADFGTSTKLLPTSADAIAGLDWEKITLGFDSWRWGGDNSNFRSVHPLMQEEPA